MAIQTCARKELRNYFNSPVAFIFLGAFLLVTLFIFFSQAKFFARNLADVRPLFSSLPWLLVFLVAALTQRQWSEEQKLGTLEILMTLPCRVRDLVLGKFFAGMALVGLALALTLPLPITAALLGNLDLGPVVGGYIAAILCAATYMSVGLCVSAKTDNQIVALMVTALLCMALYLLGSDTLVGLFGNNIAEVLRSLGTGSRFESIERGVLDIRDFAYYISLCVFFLALNVVFIESKRGVGQPLSAEGRSHRRTLWLIALNALALNVWLAPCSSARIDLTAEGEYSVSDATARIVSNLEEPLIISAFISEKTHPLLAPLVPRIKDFLNEYELLGHGKVRLVFADPGLDEQLEREVGERYEIKPVPFRVSGRHEESVVNSYFHLVVSFGDQFEVLGFNKIIDLYADENEIKVRLRNLEYDLTRSIKKVTEGFQSIEAVLARSDVTSKLTAYMSANLPNEFADVPQYVDKIVAELSQKSGGRFVFEQLDPSNDSALQAKLLKEYGFRPMSLDFLSDERFYLYFLYEAGDHLEAIYPQGEMTEASLRTSIEGAIRRGTPGFLKTVALLTETPAENPQLAMFGQRAPDPDFQQLESSLLEDFQFKRVDLEDGVVPGDVDVLIVSKAGTLSEKQRFAIDQYLMRGGAVFVMTGAFDMKPGYENIEAVPVDEALLNQLAKYGAEIERGFAMDPLNTMFPVPVAERRGAFSVQRIVMMPYPFFPDLRQENFARGHVALSGLTSVAFTWGSPVRMSEKLPEGVKGEVLLHSSDESYVRTSTNTTPNLENDRDPFPRGDAKMESLPLALTLVGSFESAFTSSPLDEEENSNQNKEVEDDRVIHRARPDARLVVLGSSAFASDLVAQIGASIGGGTFRGNNVLVRNLIDWALSDTDLLEIRSAGAFARTLRPMEPAERTVYELANYAVVLVALLAVLLVGVFRRRMAQPIVLVDDLSEDGVQK